MTNKTKIAIVGGLLALVVLLVWMMNGTKPEQNVHGKKSVPAIISTNWDDEYDLLSKDANGLYMFNYFLKSRLKRSQEVAKIDHKYSLDTLPKNAHPTFIYVGDRFVLTEEEIDTIFSKVADGSKLFLAQHELDEGIYRRLFDNVELSFDYNSKITVKTEQNSYSFYKVFQNDTISNKWRGFKNVLTSTSSDHKVLSKIGNLESNIVLQWGKGFIYLCATPELFVNYQLKGKDGFGHSKIWLNRIPENENVYWLELGRYKEEPEEDYMDEFMEGDDERDDSYLQFIFQQKSLVYAMILLLFGVIIYVIFRAKRTQPAVPYIGKKQNMTMVFTDTITSIYFADRNPYVMLGIQKKNFYNAVQKHFFVDLSKRKEDREIKALAQKSNISEIEINELINGFETTMVSSVDDNYLIDMSKKQVEFYKRTGMISSKVQEKIEGQEFKLYRNLWLSSLLLMGGLLVLFFGFYFLVNAVGVGIIFWPVGAALLTVAVLRMSKPFVIVSKSQIVYISLFGRKKIYATDDIHSIESSEKGTKFRFNGGGILIVNYWELNHTDAKQFKRFVAVQNKLKL